VGGVFLRLRQGGGVGLLFFLGGGWGGGGRRPPGGGGGGGGGGGAGERRRLERRPRQKARGSCLPSLLSFSLSVSVTGARLTGVALSIGVEGSRGRSGEMEGGRLVSCLRGLAGEGQGPSGSSECARAAGRCLGRRAAGGGRRRAVSRVRRRPPTAAASQIAKSSAVRPYECGRRRGTAHPTDAPVDSRREGRGWRDPGAAGRRAEKISDRGFLLPTPDQSLCPIALVPPAQCRAQGVLGAHGRARSARPRAPRRRAQKGDARAFLSSGRSTQKEGGKQRGGRCPHPAPPLPIHIAPFGPCRCAHLVRACVIQRRGSGPRVCVAKVGCRSRFALQVLLGLGCVFFFG